MDNQLAETQSYFLKKILRELALLNISIFVGLTALVADIILRWVA